MIKKIKQKTVTPQVLRTDRIQQAFQDVINDINEIAVQWNTKLQPLVDSLPGGQTRIPISRRTTAINPFDNGLDGSQLFTDATATRTSNAGRLFNLVEARPKSIKETILDVSMELQSEINRIEAILDLLSVQNAGYNDTNLKAWIRQLAANTVSDLDLGDTFDAAYFAGNSPTKTVQFSLHQRDANLRALMGLDGDYSRTNPGFVDTNYIDEDTIIQALIDLDAELAAAILDGTSTLQEAYDSGDGTIVCVSEKPVWIDAALETNTGLSLGGIFTQHNLSDEKTISLCSNKVAFLNSLNFFVPSEDESTYLDGTVIAKNTILRAERDVGISTDAVTLFVGPPSPGANTVYSVIRGGRTNDAGPDTSMWSLGNLDADENLCYLSSSAALEIYSPSQIRDRTLTRFITIDGLFREIGGPIDTGIFVIQDSLETTAFAITGYQNWAVNSTNTASADLAITATGALWPTAYAPRGDFSAAGAPVIDKSGVIPIIPYLYRDNVVKAAGSIQIDRTDGDAITVKHQYNINDQTIVYNDATGSLTVEVLGTFGGDTDSRTVVATVQANAADITGATMLCPIVLTTADSSTICVRVLEFDTINLTWKLPSLLIFTINFEAL